MPNIFLEVVKIKKKTYFKSVSEIKTLILQNGKFRLHIHLDFPSDSVIEEMG